MCSDTHFGHKNIIRYCDRPFESVVVMNAALIERWNSRVTPEDVVYFLGDLAMGPGVDEQFVLDILRQLNGYKLMIPGNHDQPNKKYKQLGLKKIVEDYEDLYVDILPDIYELTHEGTSFVMCHYPMGDWNGRFHGSVRLHGHVHVEVVPTPERVTEEHTVFPNGVWTKSHLPHVENRYDVGVDTYGGPVELTGDLRYILAPRGWNDA